mmetsp:Transcript_12300/g.35563  ORF Transcript_12300/g.35563 Transcript_12300/m.35563 type:complete len:220 (-) Transcript_12300:197-856(-)
MTSWSFSASQGMRRTQTLFSWATMWTAGTTRWSVQLWWCSSRPASPLGCAFSAATTSLGRSLKCMASTTNASANLGRPRSGSNSWRSSTTSLSLHPSRARFSAPMLVSRLLSTPWTSCRAFRGSKKCPTRAQSATWYGPIRTTTWAGASRPAALDTPLAQISPSSSITTMASTLSSARTNLLWRVSSGHTPTSVSPSSLRPTIATAAATRPRSCLWMRI